MKNMMVTFMDYYEEHLNLEFPEAIVLLFCYCYRMKHLEKTPATEPLELIQLIVF